MEEQYFTCTFLWHMVIHRPQTWGLPCPMTILPLGYFLVAFNYTIQFNKTLHNEDMCTHTIKNKQGIYVPIVCHRRQFPHVAVENSIMSFNWPIGTVRIFCHGSRSLSEPKLFRHRSWSQKRFGVCKNCKCPTNGWVTSKICGEFMFSNMLIKMNDVNWKEEHLASSYGIWCLSFSHVYEH